MKGFKDFIADDMRVFFNIEEMAEIRSVNDKEMKVVIVEDLSTGRPQQLHEVGHMADSMYLKQIVMYVPVTDFGKRPNAEAKMKIDNKLYIVKNCNEQMGVYEITLEANRS